MTDTPVEMSGFAREPEELKRAMLASAQEVLASDTWILGSRVEAFERVFSAFVGARHTVGVGNGLDAIEIILRAREIGPGDEVITTPMTAVATVLGIVRAGATPVLADIDSTTALLDPSSVERCLTPKTRAVMPVHLYGQMRDLDTWVDLCGAHGLELVEDCAQSHGATWAGRHGGTIGIAGAYSFYPTKNLGAVGDAGAVVSNDDEVARLAAALRNYGQEGRYNHVEVGLNSRLDEVQATLLSARLAWLNEFTARRRAIATEYRTRITNPAITHLVPPKTPESHVYHLFVITTEHREALIAHLGDRGIHSLIHYPVPVHRQPAFLGIRSDTAGLRHSEQHASTCLSLPCHPQLTDDEVERVIAAVETFRG